MQFACVPVPESTSLAAIQEVVRLGGHGRSKIMQTSCRPGMKLLR